MTTPNDSAEQEAFEKKYADFKRIADPTNGESAAWLNGWCAALAQPVPAADVPKVHELDLASRIVRHICEMDEAPDGPDTLTVTMDQLQLAIEVELETDAEMRAAAPPPAIPNDDESPLTEPEMAALAGLSIKELRAIAASISAAPAIPTEPVAKQKFGDAVMEAAQRKASFYDDDPRQDIRVDVLNAFHAGAYFVWNIYTAQPVEQTTLTDAFWVIEHPGNTPTYWMGNAGLHEFTSDIDKATQFRRKQDALSVICEKGINLFVSEHVMLAEVAAQGGKT